MTEKVPTEIPCAGCQKKIIFLIKTSSFISLKNNPNFILPETRKNEVVAFINRGLQDICISRKNAGWGIPVPNDPERVVYVWFDALINYLSAINWPDGDWQDFWPPQVQWMGKEILVRFHATLWPAMLMALDLPMPESLVGH